jgi:sugar phosphate isomerase/epimerase
MQTHGDKQGKKILVIGEGDRDREVFQAIAKSGYNGPIGILNHTNEDAYKRLRANLEGLEKVVKAYIAP